MQGVHVFEGDKDVTDQYDISIDPNGKVVATRKTHLRLIIIKGELPVTIEAVIMNAKIPYQ